MDSVVMTVRIDREMREALEEVADMNGQTITAEIRDIIEDYLRRNYVESNGSEHDAPELFDKLPDDRKKEIVAYIRKTYTDADEYNVSTSYGLKHGKTEEALGYLKNGEFKGAMLAAGFEPKYYLSANWEFKCKEKRAARKGIMKFVEKKFKTGAGSVKMFAGDMLADRKFDGVETIKDLAIVKMRVAMCDKAESVVKRLMREYGETHEMEMYEFVYWLGEAKLYHRFEQHIPEQWRCMCKKTISATWEEDDAAFDTEVLKYVPSGLRED